jgi:hypothetical protein
MRNEADFDAQKILNYKNDVELADLLYKAYTTLGISRLDKIDGRFLLVKQLNLILLLNRILKLLNYYRK